MNIKKKLQIVDILFRTTDGEDVSEEHVNQMLESLVRNPLKRERFKTHMLEKYGPEVFTRRAKNMAKAVDEKGPEWRKERASKASKSAKEYQDEEDNY